jgi:beta-galactosidase/beta-glucuronidase
MDALVRNLRGLQANATRAQHPLSPALMERLDAAGILVWMGVGPSTLRALDVARAEARRQSRERVRASLEQLQPHPSLLAWNLANEVAGQGHPAGQAPYIDAVARELKRRDPGRLVALDIWGSHPPREPGPMYANIDVLGWTNYLGWYDDTFVEGRRARRAHPRGARARCAASSPTRRSR